MNVAIVNCFDTYEHRVDLLHDFFVHNGDKVRVYTSDYRHIEKIVRNEFKKDYIFVHAKPYKTNISVDRIFSHIKWSKSVFERLNTQNVDLLWVLVPPNTLVREAAALKKRHSNVKLVFDIIDMWPETMPVQKIKKLPVITKWAQLRDKYLNYADFVATECGLYQQKLNVPVNKMMTVYLARKALPFSGKPGLSSGRVSLCYLGSINNIIDIQTICKIIKLFQRSKDVDLHIIGDGENRESLIAEAENAGANVIFHGKVYDADEKQKIFDSCHYGLNIMKNTVFVGLTMKSIDYLEAGLPIINNIKGDTWDIVDEYNIGQNFNSSFMTIPDDYFESRRNARYFFETSLDIGTFNDKINLILEKIK